MVITHFLIFFIIFFKTFDLNICIEITNPLSDDRIVVPRFALSSATLTLEPMNSLFMIVPKLKQELPAHLLKNYSIQWSLQIFTENLEIKTEKLCGTYPVFLYLTTHDT